MKRNRENKTAYWIADKGNPKHLINIKTACNQNIKRDKVKQLDKSLGDFRCFNNNKIDI